MQNNSIHFYLKKIVIPGDADTVFGDPFYCSSNRLIIYGPPGGKIENYAKQYGYTFKPL